MLVFGFAESTSSDRISYRPDIDGLRALAVLPVVASHGGLLPGGYAGVDVFFVISGFLITRLLVRDIEQRRLSIATFYARRFVRLFPALYCVILVSAIGAYLLFLPEDLKIFGYSIISTCLFVSNIFFWNEVDYWDPVADLKPLLHTWSLAVEEQFYIVFPTLLFACFLFGRRRFDSWPARGAMVAFFLGSLIVSIVAVRETPVAAFYLAASRAWELLCGAMLALAILPAIRNPALRQTAGVFGLVLVVGSYLLLTENSEFPGLGALPVCVGATLIIASGERGDTFVFRLLSHRALVFIGLISYSLYLWHWPVAVFARYVSIEPLTLAQSLAYVAASIGLGALSWWLIERPTRPLVRHGTKAILTAGVGLIGAGVAMGAFLASDQGRQGRVAPEVLAIADSDQYRDPLQPRCHETFRRKLEDLCVRGAGGVVPTFLLAGDSHAGSVAAAVFQAAEAQGVSGVQLSDAGWTPVPDLLKFGETEKYRILNHRLLDILNGNAKLNTVIIINYWHQALGNSYIDVDGRRKSGDQAVASALTQLVRAFPDRRFIFMRPPPSALDFGRHPAARAAFLGRTDFRPRVSEEAYLRDTRPFVRATDVLSREPNVTMLDPGPFLCSHGECPGGDIGGLWYRDDNHLSVYGAMRLEPLFRSIWQSVK